MSEECNDGHCPSHSRASIRQVSIEWDDAVIIDYIDAWAVVSHVNEYELTKASIDRTKNLILNNMGFDLEPMPEVPLFETLVIKLPSDTSNLLDNPQVTYLNQFVHFRQTIDDVEFIESAHDMVLEAVKADLIDLSKEIEDE